MRNFSLFIWLKFCCDYLRSFSPGWNLSPSTHPSSSQDMYGVSFSEQLVLFSIFWLVKVKGCICCNEGYCYFLALYWKCCILHCWNDGLAIVLDRNWWFISASFILRIYMLPSVSDHNCFFETKTAQKPYSLGPHIDSTLESPFWT